MENQILSIAQMQELIELGIDTSNASMCWKYSNYDPFSKSINIRMPNDDNCIPTFTLQDMLTLMKDRIIKLETSGVNWKCGNMAMWFVADSPLKATFNMLKWCKQNNYI